MTDALTMQHWSCADYSLPMLSHEVAMTVMADIGMRAVDVGVFGEDTHVRVSDVVADPAAAAEQVRQSVEAAGLDTVADVFLTPHERFDVLEPTNLDPEDQRRSLRILEATCRFAQELGTSGVTLLPGIRRTGQSTSEAIAVAADGLRPRVELARAMDLRLSFEPHLGSLTETPQLVADLVDAVPGLEITLDPAHLGYPGYVAADLDVLAPHVRHVQLRAGRMGEIQSRLPDNDIDFAAILRRLAAVGYDGWLALEYVWMEQWDSDRVDIITETIRLRDHLAPLLGSDPASL